MAEVATIARPYAEALFKAASHDTSGTQAWLDALSSIASDAQVLHLAANPLISQDQVFELINSVSQEKMPEMAKNFLKLLIENSRLGALPEIAKQFRVLKNAQSGASDAWVGSAFPIDANTLASVSKELEAKFGRRLNVTVHLEPELIGGIRVVVGDEVFDTSIKTRLEQMKAALTA